jgi:hypothetical protein
VQMPPKGVVTDRGVRPMVDYVFDAEGSYGGYRMRSPADLAALRDTTVSKYSDQMPANRAGCTVARAVGSSGPPLPKVTILNREVASGRHLYNTVELKLALETELGLASVSVVSSMDGKTFVEQVGVMQQTDILISPHGAQWISIPFLPVCANTVEVFAPSYYTPKFYGSLASTSALTYWNVYTGGDDHTVHTRMGSLEERRASREDHMCLTSETIQNKIIPTLREIIHEWRRCCNFH